VRKREVRGGEGVKKGEGKEGEGERREREEKWETTYQFIGSTNSC